MDDDAQQLAREFVKWASQDGTTEAALKARFREYHERRKAGESHEQILGLPEEVSSDG